jgi:hypothetical protein
LAKFVWGRERWALWIEREEEEEEVEEGKHNDKK